MKLIATMPYSTDEFRNLVRARLDIESTPMESGHTQIGEDAYRVTLGFRADENGVGLTKDMGYTIEFKATDTGATDFYGASLYEFGNFDLYPNDAWDKVIRTHEEVKNELDRLWESSTYDERYVLRRLYEFMQEIRPED